MKLDRWILQGNTLVGYLYDGPFPKGTRVQTEAIRFIDLSNLKAECLDGRYKLGEPGTVEEHQRELIGKKTEAELPVVSNLIFLNPRG